MAEPDALITYDFKKKLIGVSLKIKGVGTQQWVLEHIRSEFGVDMSKNRELLKNKSLKYEWNMHTDHIFYLKLSFFSLKIKWLLNFYSEFRNTLEVVWCSLHEFPVSY